MSEVGRRVAAPQDRGLTGALGTVTNRQDVLGNGLARRVIGALARLSVVRRLRFALEWYSGESVVPYTRFRLQPEMLKDAIRANRSVLDRIDSWLDMDALKASVYNYGIPPALLPVLDRPVGSEPTYSDLLVTIGRALEEDLRYLEVGVSVGENLVQMIANVNQGLFVGIDLEDIHPILEREMTCEGEIRWVPGPKSRRKRMSYLRRYRVKASGSQVLYLAGDVNDELLWQQLRGHRFNLIFSDALHSPEGLRTEYLAWKENKLLDERQCTIVWDDLDRLEMRAEFHNIAIDLVRETEPSRRVASVEFYRGWVGVHEYRHVIGILVLAWEQMSMRKL